MLESIAFVFRLLHLC